MAGTRIMINMPGIVTTHVGLKLWTKIFGKPSVKELVHKGGSLETER